MNSTTQFDYNDFKQFLKSEAELSDYDETQYGEIISISKEFKQNKLVYFITASFKKNGEFSYGYIMKTSKPYGTAQYIGTDSAHTLHELKAIYRAYFGTTIYV